VNTTRYACPCCGYLTLSEPPGSFDVCLVCFWEDDNVQLENPDYEGGANMRSLNQARANFQKIGASDPAFTSDVRPPKPEEIPEK
jgi:hypothetical protein